MGRQPGAVPVPRRDPVAAVGHPGDGGRPQHARHPAPRRGPPHQHRAVRGGVRGHPRLLRRRGHRHRALAARHRQLARLAAGGDAAGAGPRAHRRLPRVPGALHRLVLHRRVAQGGGPGGRRRPAARAAPDPGRLPAGRRALGRGAARPPLRRLSQAGAPDPRRARLAGPGLGRRLQPRRRRPDRPGRSAAASALPGGAGLGRSGPRGPPPPRATAPPVRSRGAHRPPPSGPSRRLSPPGFSIMLAPTPHRGGRVSAVSLATPVGDPTDQPRMA